MTLKKVFAFSSLMGLTIAISNSALALDTRCSTEGSQVPYCIGGDENLTNTAQKPIMLGFPNYGSIIKNFKYILPANAGGTDSEGCCGAWVAGIALAGHMSAPDDWSSYYKPGAKGLYVDNVDIKGESDSKEIAGIMHYNGFSTAGSHRDNLYIDNVNIDVGNTNTNALTTSYPWLYYSAYGVMSYVEGNNKNAIVNMGGDSHIKVNIKCKEGEACFPGDIGSSGVTAASIKGYAQINVDENVVIESIGDMVFGERIHTRTGSETVPADGILDNKGTVSTNGSKSHAINVFNEWSLGRNASVTNTGVLQTGGYASHGIYTSGYTTNTVTNGGLILAIEEDSSGIFVTERKVSATDNKAVVTLMPESVIFGGVGNNAAGVKLESLMGSKFISNAGSINSVNYKSIDVSNSISGDFTLENQGEINGYQTIQDTTVNIINQEKGVFNLEYLDLARSCSPVTSKFSKQNTAVFQNNGTIRFAESMNGCASETGNYTGIKEFYANEGSNIDLTENNKLNTSLNVGQNNQVGDHFIITNDTNDAVYYSNGGSITLNVDLTKANQASLDDRLADRVVLDKAVLKDDKPTLINIVPTKNSLTKAQATAGEGILLIEVKGSSDCNTFALAKPVKVGAKEYVLKQSNQSWYLVSK